MRIGMVCYASVGGSGVVATELAHALVDRGHHVHLISSDPPFRWRPGPRGPAFDRVSVPSYPLFREPQYLLAMANTIVRVAEAHRLDIIHAHYAVPHATAAYLADRILASASSTPPPRTVTTLHGTDITLVGSDPSYARVVAFSIEQSDSVTTVSRSLRADTITRLGISHDIRVIPNFLDCDVYRRQVEPGLRERLTGAGPGDAVVVHMSNFRPVKRVEMVMEAFRRIRQDVSARLVLIGDGPVRPDIERLAEAHGTGGDVIFVGERQDPVPWLSSGDVFLLPSEQESFGLAALEAMACGTPVVASDVGGLSEIIENGVTGFLCPPTGLAQAMAERALTLIRDADRREAMSRAAVESVQSNYCTGRIVPLYEQAYEDVLR
jgi:N-acetyl-alpha-D-glucosaminyl L-malate synthase BshA